MKKNPLEWTVFGISFAIILATAAVLVHAHLTSAQRPPVIVVVAGPAVAQARGYVIQLDVSNDGDTTAQNVRIEVHLSGPGVDERSEVELTFVPHGSHRRAWVTFTNNPERFTVSTRVVSYEEP